MRRQFQWNWHHEWHLSHGRVMRGHSRHRDEHGHENCAILILTADAGSVLVVALVLVSGPMRVDRMAIVVGSRVFVRVRVYKRSAQRRDHDGQRERYRYSFPHHSSIVGETAHRVKAPAEARADRDVNGSPVLMKIERPGAPVSQNAGAPVSVECFGWP